MFPKEQWITTTWADPDMDEFKKRFLESITYKKENEKMNDDHAIMNSLKKGMYVENVRLGDGTRGFIEAFDYKSMHVGVRCENRPSYEGLWWFKPSDIRVVAKPASSEIKCYGRTPNIVIYGEKCGDISIPEIKDVIFSPPATIVFWTDNTKTVVKCQDGDIFDPEKGLAMAISKKALGNRGNYYNEFQKWVSKYDVPCLYPNQVINFDGLAIKEAVMSVSDFIEKRIKDIKEKKNET